MSILTLRHQQINRGCKGKVLLWQQFLTWKETRKGYIVTHSHIPTTYGVDFQHIEYNLSNLDKCRSIFDRMPRIQTMAIEQTAEVQETHQKPTGKPSIDSME